MGIALGWAARLIIQPPVEENNRTFKVPLPDEVPLDFPLERDESEDEETEETGASLSSWVEPFDLPSNVAVIGSNYVGSTRAVFEPHGEEICASGCSLSRHPTENLSRVEFEQLLTTYANGPLSSDNRALESLLYYGTQTKQLLFDKERSIEAKLTAALSDRYLNFLDEQLAFTHAEISIRIRDDAREDWSWLEPTIVPLDRRHVFTMTTERLQPLEMSGTVKRVGLQHLWTRL